MKSRVQGRSGGGDGLVRVYCALLGTCILGACQSTVASQGKKRDVIASYQFRTLEAKLGPEVQVLTVQAAAEQALRARGYVITSATGSNDLARVEAKSGGTAAGDWERVVVETWVGGGSGGSGGGAGAGAFTGISVTCEPWGDQVMSRAVLDGVLNRLGR